MICGKALWGEGVLGMDTWPGKHSLSCGPAPHRSSKLVFTTSPLLPASGKLLLTVTYHYQNWKIHDGKRNKASHLLLIESRVGKHTVDSGLYLDTSRPSPPLPAPL